MKFTTIYLGENKIEIHNSLLGKETIKVNGEVVSGKFSVTGAEHLFPITENETAVNCKIRIGYGLSGVVFDLYKNNQPVIQSPMPGYLSFYIIGIALAIIIVIEGILL